MVSLIMDGGGPGPTAEAGGLFVVIVVLDLVVMLIIREFSSAAAASGSQRGRYQFLAKASNGSIVAFLGVFIIVVVAQILLAI